MTFWKLFVLPSSPITSGGNISSNLPKATLKAVVLYVLGTSPDGLWAWALVRSEERQLPENSSVSLAHHSESVGTEKRESQAQFGTFANPRVAILQQLPQLHSLKHIFILLEFISYN